ncbi:hypothetical protein [uncultured Paraglaciecola sp.]|uniref:hypothetical protein n=1 Tax=uncultured Paraglaciecola sp. TaxID=1765024 RepID=UPI0030D72764
MKHSTKILVSSLISLIVCQVVVAKSDNQSRDDYSVVAFKNCEMVSHQAMTEKGIAAYLALQKEEQKMQGLEIPIQGIEQEMQEYTDSIEKLTKLAIQESDESLHIDKKLMQKQKVVVKEFDKFMQKHQQDFDAIGAQGIIIGQHAEVFENSIKENLEGIDYDQIQVLASDKALTMSNCKNSIEVIVI